MTPHPSPERVKPSDGLVEVVAMTIWNNLNWFGHFTPEAVSARWGNVPDKDYFTGGDEPAERRGRDSYRTAAREILGLPALANAEATIAELREALAFYGMEWHADIDAQPYPNPALFRDSGKLARAALARTAPATAERP